jgi:hypothetical protein
MVRRQPSWRNTRLTRSHLQRGSGPRQDQGPASRELAPCRVVAVRLRSLDRTFGKRLTGGSGQSGKHVTRGLDRQQKVFKIPTNCGFYPGFFQQRDSAPQHGLWLGARGSCAMGVIFMAQQWRKWFCAMMKVALKGKAWRKLRRHAVPEVAQPWRMAHLCCRCGS